MNKVLVIGSGGREHAIIHSIKKSPLVEKIFSIPGNGGIEEIAECFSDIKIDDHKSIIKFCQEKEIDLVVIGPEQPLIAGLADDLRAVNIKTFGPSKLASRLEGSKIFMKEICDKYQIPTAKYQSFSDEEEAVKYLNDVGFPCVVKADGVAAGKGVIIAQDRKEAVLAIKEVLGGKFGDAGNEIVIEEFLEGPEVSFFAICDGSKSLFFGTAGDHKKVGEGETGLNTGGMGTYSPSPLISADLQNEVIKTMIEPTLKAMEDMNSVFSGFLFAGLILTKDGPKLLEFNTRFGDPEAQSILPRLESDLFELMLKVSRGDLGDSEVKFNDKSALCVVLAAKGYPESYKKGTQINNLEKIQNLGDDVTIFHAGTKKDQNKLLANGGRVLGVTAIASNIDQSRQIAYEAVDLIDWEDGFYRRDIGLKIISSC